MRNVATGVGVAAAGAVCAYLLSQVFNSSEETPRDGRFLYLFNYMS